MDLKLTDYKQFPSIPGIYKITNLINGKNYIGQAKNLKDRLSSHYFTYKRGDNKRMILYKALTKYGIENFSVSIIETIKEYDIVILNKLEIKYIEEFNSFGPTCYNQTKGGDGGVLGYKHKEYTIKKIGKLAKENYRKIHSNSFLWPRAKNWETGEEFIACTIKELGQLIGVTIDPILKCLNGKQNNIYGIWTFARNGEEFPKVTLKSNGQFVNKLEVQEVQQYYLEHPELTVKEIASHFKVCTKTIYNYKKKFK